MQENSVALRLWCPLLLVLAMAASAFGWSTKEHILITRCAVRNLLENRRTPDAMKAWLREAQPALGSLEEERRFLLVGRVGQYPRGVDGLAFWSTMPDVVADSAYGRQTNVAPYGVPERQLHFIDLELLQSDEKARTFAEDLSHKPKLADIPRDIKDARYPKAGYLPFRVEECYRKTVQMMRSGRLVDKPGQFPRDEHAVRWAGLLAHYAADNTMPMHGTVDYQAASFFSGIEKKPKVHSDMEFRLVDDDDADYPELRAEFWKRFLTDLQKRDRRAGAEDVWTSSLQLQLEAYDALPLIGHAARAAYLDESGKLKPFDAAAFFGFRGLVAGNELSVMELKARQMAEAVKWIETLWARAWEEAQARP